MKFESCNMVMKNLFTVDWVRNFAPLIQPMLEGGIEVLIYAGDQDFICNWLGNEKWTLALNWTQKAAFNAASMKPWSVTDAAGRSQSAGRLRSHANFHFL